MGVALLPAMVLLLRIQSWDELQLPRHAVLGQFRSCQVENQNLQGQERLDQTSLIVQLEFVVFIFIV